MRIWTNRIRSCVGSRRRHVVVRDAAGRRSARTARARAAPQPPAGPTPRLANGKPDLSGHWQNPYTPNMAGRGLVLDPKTRQPLTFARQGEALPDAAANTGNSTARRTFDLPYTEWGLKHWKEYDPVKNGEYTASCLPFGMSRNINSPHGLVIVHHPDSLAFLFEQNTWFHWVPTQRDEVAGRPAAQLERRLDRTLGRRHADYRDHAVSTATPAWTRPGIRTARN